MQTLALEMTTPLNEYTGRLSRVSTRHKHNRRNTQLNVLLVSVVTIAVDGNVCLWECANNL